MKRVLLFALMASLAWNLSEAAAQEKTHEVKRSDFRIVESVTGTVESKKMTEVAANTETWSDLIIDSVVDQGTVVKAGDELLKFKTESIDKKLKEAKRGVELSALSVQTANLELDQLQQTFDLDSQLAERQHRINKEDFDYFVEVEKPNREKSIEHSLRSAQYSLENSQEELTQLQRMYQEDELTEESEEIVLKRAKRAVESSQFYLEQAQIRAAKTLDKDLPRELDQKKDALERAMLEYEKSKVMLPIGRDKKRIEVDKAEFAFENEQREFEKLESDREKMVLTAPADGVVYHGKCVNGKWVSSAGSGPRTLTEGKAAGSKSTLITIVDISDLHIRCTLSEKQLQFLRAGSSGVGTAPISPGSSFDVSIADVSYVPSATDQFSCTANLSVGDLKLMPGMTCQMKFVAYAKENAIAVPSSAVFSDDLKNHYVYVVDGEDSRKQSVTVGHASSDKTEITDGLNEGDKILLTKPE